MRMGCRLFRLAATVGLAAVMLACFPASAGACEAAAERPPENGSASSAKAPESKPAAREGSAARIAKNFLVLMGDSWKDIGKLALRLTFSVVLWGAGLLLAGGAAGLIAWLLLRKRRLFDAPFRWYRWVRWLWAVVFVIVPALGCGYAGLWLGGGRAVKRFIREDLIIDRVVANMLVAIFLDSADYAVTGRSQTDEIERVLADSEKVRKLVQDDFAEAVRDFAESPKASFAQRWLVRLASTSELQAAADQALQHVDPALVFVVFIANRNVDEYLQQHPGARLPIAALSAHFASVRNKACGLVDDAVHGNLALGALLGAGIPLVLLGAFRLALWLVARRQARLAERAIAGKG